MSTYRELIYIINDELKLVSDDSIITEEHILFSILKYRAALLVQKYSNIKQQIPESNYQTITLDLEQYKPYENCDLPYLRSVNPIPDSIKVCKPNIYGADYFNGNICWVSRNRMKFIGETKYNKSIIYATLGADNKIYLKAFNSQYLWLKQINISSVFEDPIKAAEQSGNDNSGTYKCDIYDMECPLEESLISIVIKSVVVDFMSVLSNNPDNINNAKDDTSSLNAK